MSQPTGTQSGTAGTDPNAQSGTGESGQTGQQPSQTDPTQAPGAQSGDGQQNVVAREDFERVPNQLRAADQKRAEAEKKLTDAERAKLDETERTKAELADAKTALATAQDQIKSMSLELAFLKDNTFKWRDPEAALRLADLSGVEYKEDGSVSGLKDALKRLADNKKYLLQEEEPQQQSGQRRTPSMNGTGNQNPPDRNALENKFPALRGRTARQG
jgi:hypothetical protein